MVWRRSVITWLDWVLTWPFWQQCGKSLGGEWGLGWEGLTCLWGEQYQLRVPTARMGQLRPEKWHNQAQNPCLLIFRTDIAGTFRYPTLKCNTDFCCLVFALWKWYCSGVFEDATSMHTLVWDSLVWWWYVRVPTVGELLLSPSWQENKVPTQYFLSVVFL